MDWRERRSSSFFSACLASCTYKRQQLGYIILGNTIELTHQTSRSRFASVTVKQLNQANKAVVDFTLGQQIEPKSRLEWLR